MSWWTEIILTATLLENTSGEDEPGKYPAIDALNEWLAPFGMFQISNPDPHRHSPHACFTGMVKSLNHDGFIEKVRASPWRWREQIQLFLRQEDNNGFCEVKLWE
jgi:hypothetical protein